MDAPDPTNARKIARTLLKAQRLNSNRVPVESVARANGCVVKTAPLDDGLSGMAFIKDGVRAIVVNAKHHPNRQRFTIAHELGHHMLHMSLLNEGVHVDTVIYKRDAEAASGTDPYEIEANQFAAELLMPEKTIRRLIPPHLDLNDDDQLSHIARAIGVSTAALSFRIRNVF